MATTTQQRRRQISNHQLSTTQPLPPQPISTVYNPPQHWPKINIKANQTIRKPNSKSSQTHQRTHMKNQWKLVGSTAIVTTALPCYCRCIYLATATRSNSKSTKKKLNKKPILKTQINPNPNPKLMLSSLLPLRLRWSVRLCLERESEESDLRFV